MEIDGAGLERYGVAVELMVLKALFKQDPGGTGYQVFHFVMLIGLNSSSERLCMRKHGVWPWKNAQVGLMRA